MIPPDRYRLKKEMERIWKEEVIACPCHLVRWTLNPEYLKACFGHPRFGYSNLSELLSYTKGTKR